MALSDEAIGRVKALVLESRYSDNIELHMQRIDKLFAKKLEILEQYNKACQEDMEQDPQDLKAKSSFRRLFFPCFGQ